MSLITRVYGMYSWNNILHKHGFMCPDDVYSVCVCVCCMYVCVYMCACLYTRVCIYLAVVSNMTIARKQHSLQALI